MRARSGSNSAAVVRWLRLKIAATAPTADIEWWWWCGAGQHTEERTTTAPRPQQRCSLCCTAVVWRKAAAGSCLGFGWRGGDHPTAPQHHHSNLFAVRAAAALMGMRYPRLSSTVSRGLLPFNMFGSDIHHAVQDRYEVGNKTTTLFRASSMYGFVTACSLQKYFLNCMIL